MGMIEDTTPAEKFADAFVMVESAFAKFSAACLPAIKAMTELAQNAKRLEEYLKEQEDPQP